jgi:hypothetical protein
MERRHRKELRRTERRNGKHKLSPVEAEIERCNGALGLTSSTREQRDSLRQREVQELVDFIEAGRRESERIAAEQRKADAKRTEAPTVQGSAGQPALLS